MYANQLIGKKAIRVKPVPLGTYGGFGLFGEVEQNYDYSYTSDPIIILAATENHIVYKYPENHHFASTDKHILDSRWCDDNWTDYDELLELASETNMKLMQELMQELNQG